MEYMKPEIEILELELVDVIQTSSGEEGEGNGEGGLKDNELPIN